MKKNILLLFVNALVCIQLSAQQMVMNLPQSPDLGPTSMIVRATSPLLIADDWQSNTNGTIDQIVIWGGWVYDMFSPNTTFLLQMYADVPASGQIPSHPGALLWEYTAIYGSYPDPIPTPVPTGEGFYNPDGGFYIMPGDMTAWYYSFPITAANAFSVTAGTIYWLMVTATPISEPNAQFGWKCSLDHWNDKAVWKVSGGQAWYPMTYPAQHPLYLQPIDMAFIIYGTPSIQACCFPDGSCMDLTPATCLQMGGTPSATPSTCANVICPLPPQACCFPDGTCAMLLPGVCSGEGGTPMGFGSNCENTPCDTEGKDYGDAPEGTVAYPTSGVIGNFPTCKTVTTAGYIEHGNFGAWFGPMVDFETDGNAGLCPVFSPNLYDQDECWQDNDAGLIIPGSFTITGPVGAEQVNNCPNTNPVALGNTCSPVLWGQNIDINVTNNMPNQWTGYVNLLIDWNQNGQWNGFSVCQSGDVTINVNEHVLVNFPIPNGYTGPLSALFYTTPPPPGFNPGFILGPNSGYVWARFSITESPVMTNWDGNGIFEDGETEDYLFLINQSSPMDLDWGDAPDPLYPTLAVNSGAVHQIIQGLMLGNQIDAETDGQPQPQAQGDDMAGIDDEDGVMINWGMTIGSPTNITVTASAAGKLDAFTDYNADGDWTDSGEQIFTSQQLNAGANILTYIVPITASSNPSFSRYRFSLAGGLSSTGLAMSGEVEDYQAEYIPSPGIKWIQPPEINLPGIHVHDGLVNGIYERIVGADDWLCQGGVVTDIHWHGVYENQGSGINFFHLSIHADNPVTCLPAEPELWGTDVSLANANQSPSGVLNSQGQMIYNYSYYLPTPFNQVIGTRYWLDISVVSVDSQSPARWLWCEAARSHVPALCPAATKTLIAGIPSLWSPLNWATGTHSDFAFEITSLVNEEMDFGDAPDSYATTLAANGARHDVIVANLWMGAAKDLEQNGIPTLAANGDDLNNLPDEDGVAFNTALIKGQNATVTVTANQANALIDAWIDFNGDGDFSEANEQFIVNALSVVGPNVFNFAIPNNAITDTTYLRFRISTVPNLPSFGYAPNGEVEDYMKMIQAPTLPTDFGDAPDSPYPTLLANNGARHLIVPAVFLGNFIDGENDGIPSTAANGDDINNTDDEDGVIINWGGKTGSPINLNVTASVSGFLDAWADFNNDGDWVDPGEKIFNTTPLVAGQNFLSFVVPANSDTNGLYSRFRYSLQGGLTFTGLAADGEVEDYKLTVTHDATIKWDQPVNPSLPGLHAHDAVVAQNNVSIYLADDWLCSGNPVTQIVWYGAYENPASGIHHFNLKILPDQPSACLPGLPAYLDVNIPLGLLNETSTGVYTIDNHLIYKYTYDLPRPFLQQSGARYWLALSSYSNNIQQPALWRWSEAARSHVPALCKAATMSVTNNNLGPWATLSSFNNRYPELAFEIISGSVIPDDFFIKVGSWVIAEPWHNWFGGVNDTTPVQLLTHDPLHMITQVIFSYSTLPGLWTVFDADNDGDEVSPAWEGSMEIGDGWTGHLVNMELAQIYGPVFFKAEIVLNNGEIIEYTRTEPINYDPTPPSSFTINVTDFQTIETDVLHWDVAPGMANLSLAEAWVDPKPKIFNKGIPHAGQLNPSFEKGGQAYCAPTSASACLHYFAPQHPGIIGGYDLNTLTNVLSNKFYTDPDSGTLLSDVVNGLRKWINNNGGGFTVRGVNCWELDASNQWKSNFNLLDWMTMRNELERCQDVLAQWCWVNSAGKLEKGHMTTFNSIHNDMVMNINVDFMDPYTADEEVGNLNPSNGYLTGYANGSPEHPEYSNQTAQLGGYVIVCPAEGVSHPGIGKIKMGFDPPADTFVLRLPGLYWLHLVVVDQDGNSARKDLVIKRLSVDYGDAPDSYQTLFASNGARHQIDSLTYLGNLIDSDPDGQPCPLAQCDDENDLDDEDGITFPWPLKKGNPALINANASVGGGFLNAWIDYNGDGDWNESNEHVFTDRVLHAGINHLGFVIPANAQTGATFARFRYSTVQGLNYFGPAPNGEVEDYLVEITTTATGIKWEQPYNPQYSGYHAHDYILNSTLHEENFADDWICPGGVITDIHWWGNYEVNGDVELRGSGIDHFDIKIYSELAGCMVGTQPLVSYTVPLANAGENMTGVLTPEGSMIYEYTYYLSDPFNQVEGNSYWISITAHSVLPGQPAIWRWCESDRTETAFLCTTKTRSVIGGVPSPWTDVFSASNMNINMAFILTNVPAEPMEFGDAPDSYQTLLASNGARHASVNQNIFMGAVRDLELNGQPTLTALGDDNNNIDDEDGVTFNTPLVQGQQATLTVVSSFANAILEGWIDFNGDGDFLDANEWVIVNSNTLLGGNTYLIPVPADATLDTTYARFRISTTPNLPPFGYASYGEVEDYMIQIQAPAPDLDFGDAPDSYSTTLAVNGARHALGGPMWMGATVDAEGNGLPSMGANGDDLNNLDDEDGVIFPWPLKKGNPATVIVNASVGGGFLDVWIDYNKDGDWSEGNEHVFVSKILHIGNNLLGFVIPAGAQTGDTYARFRYSSIQGLSYTGQAPDGEVEDYLVNITTTSSGIKWEQPVNPQYSGYHAHDYLMNSQLHEENYADDWICPGGVVTDIHWWGNYEVNGGVELRGSGIDHFEINIYSQPAGCIVGSQPLATYIVPLANVNENGTGITTPEGSMIYEYTYYLTTPFNQVEGTPYWISITSHAVMPTYPALWRWCESDRTETAFGCTTKTRSVIAGIPGPWNDLFVGTTLHVNMAFTLTNVSPQPMDYGDAPDSYKTLLASNGARHDNIIPSLLMGPLKDLEADGLPSTGANGDDLNNLDDEDGVTFVTSFIRGQNTTIIVNSTFQNALLDAWIDFNKDGDFLDQNEQIITNYQTNAGPNQISFQVPVNAVIDSTYCRFRISTVLNLPPFGYAPNGEVEDYKIKINDENINFDWGDAPDPTYPTLFVNNGPRHAISALTLGNFIDAEQNGQPDISATGDDIAVIDDEDGISFITPLKRGQNATINVISSQNGYLNAWIDYNGDGDWYDVGEKFLIDYLVSAGTNSITWNIPNNATLGKTFLRFRLCSQQNLGLTGAAPDGEVEDYMNFIVAAGETKMHWPQPPDLNPNGNGVDVDLSWTSSADDFLCTQSGAINHIRLWGSFADDILPLFGAGGDTVQLLIHADIPVQPNITYSRPGVVLWSRIYAPGTYTVKLINNIVPQWWYDPATQAWLANNNDSTYRFDFPVTNDPFIQTEGTIYWLEVRYLHPAFQVDGTLCWKSTPPENRFNDAAVYLNTSNFNFPMGWVPLSYPPDHNLYEQPLDLSFEIYNAPPSSDIMGYLKYHSPVPEPMPQVTAMLYQGNVLLLSTLADTDGSYDFSGLPTGTYTLGGASSLPWGGVNSTDALLIMRHFVHQITLTGINLKAADVTGSSGVNSLDALMTARRFVHIIEYFPVGDWAFETPTVIIPYSGTFYRDYYALCYGDVNGTYAESFKTEPTVDLDYKDYLQGFGKSEIIIPVKTKELFSVSAISLVLKYPAEMIIGKVEIPDKTNGTLLFNAQNGELRISWYSIVPESFDANETLFYITVKTGKLPTSPYFEITPESEFGDRYGNILNDIHLYVPYLVNASLPGFFLAQNIPNPFSTTTKIVYSVPEDCRATLELRSLPGDPVLRLIDNKATEKGYHTQILDGSGLPQGIYYCTLYINTPEGRYSQTIKISIIR